MLDGPKGTAAVGDVEEEDGQSTKFLPRQKSILKSKKDAIASLGTELSGMLSAITQLDEETNRIHSDLNRLNHQNAKVGEEVEKRRVEYEAEVRRNARVKEAIGRSRAMSGAFARGIADKVSKERREEICAFVWRVVAKSAVIFDNCSTAAFLIVIEIARYRCYFIIELFWIIIRWVVSLILGGGRGDIYLGHSLDLFGVSSNVSPRNVAMTTVDVVNSSYCFHSIVFAIWVIEARLLDTIRRSFIALRQRYEHSQQATVVFNNTQLHNRHKNKFPNDPQTSPRKPPYNPNSTSSIKKIPS
jgi:hypothetical protein